MKAFEDLEFKSHPSGEGKMARMFFDNGYGVSVVRFQLSGGFGYGSYTDNEYEWELAVLKGSEDKGWNLCYDTEITPDVVGHADKDMVSVLMANIQHLPKAE